MQVHIEYLSEIHLTTFSNIIYYLASSDGICQCTMNEKWIWRKRPWRYWRNPSDSIAATEVEASTTLVYLWKRKHTGHGFMETLFVFILRTSVKVQT